MLFQSWAKDSQHSSNNKFPKSKKNKKKGSSFLFFTLGHFWGALFCFPKHWKNETFGKAKIKCPYYAPLFYKDVSEAEVNKNATPIGNRV